jgi:hypothetical protein
MPLRRFLPLLCGLLLGNSAGLIGAAPLRAAVDPRFIPPVSVFRELQLITLACGRENTEEPCARARDRADELLDHPLLPVSCKDTLWTITDKATVAPANSFERRSAIDRAAKDLTVLCRSMESRSAPQGGAVSPSPGGTPAP